MDHKVWEMSQVNIDTKPVFRFRNQTKHRFSIDVSPIIKVQTHFLVLDYYLKVVRQLAGVFLCSFCCWLPPLPGMRQTSSTHQTIHNGKIQFKVVFLIPSAVNKCCYCKVLTYQFSYLILSIIIFQHIWRSQQLSLCCLANDQHVASVQCTFWDCTMLPIMCLLTCNLKFAMVQR